MITITTNSLKSVSIEGHAGYAPKGQDIVCAAISALFETLRMALSGLNVCEFDADDHSITVTDGSDYSRILMAAFISGMELVAMQYPEHVQMIHKPAV